MLRDAPFEGEIADQQAHDHRARHIFKQRGVVEAGPEQARTHEVDAMAERSAETAAEKYDQETHACSFLAPGNKKPPCGGAPPAPAALPHRAGARQPTTARSGGR